jgi:predicted nuclease with RNAse H fold
MTDRSTSWAGVDVGGRRKGFHVTLIDRHRVLELTTLARPDEIAAWLATRSPQLVAVDSPRSPAPVGQRSRPDERELTRARVCNIRWTPDEAGLKSNPTYYEWIEHGFELYDAVSRAGLEPIECFPTASWTRWAGRREGRRRGEWSQAALESLGLALPARRLSQDERDAIGAALTARAHADGATEMFGEIVVPRALTPAPPERVPVLVLTGPVGVGKSTIGWETAMLLREAGVPAAFVDLPSIGICFPEPADDPWNERLTHQNLAALWSNFKAAGAQRLILARVLEVRSGLRCIEHAVPGAEITVARLQAPLPVIEQRIETREASDASWYLGAARSLHESMSLSPVEDHLVDNEGPPREVARAILERLRWLE